MTHFCCPGPVFRRAFLLVCLFPFFVSCASAPGAKDQAPEKDLLFLPPGASVYMHIDVARARPILDLLSIGALRGGDIPEILDRTDSAAAALYPEGSGRRFFVAARGKYPRFRSGLSFAFSSLWKKRRSPAGGSYWYSTGHKMGVSIGAGRAFLSDQDPLAVSPEIQSPGGFGALSRGALLAGWLPGAASQINTFFAARNIPLQIPAEQVLFSIHPSPPEDGEGGKYELTLYLETPSESHAQGLAAIISMMRFFMADALEPGDPLKALTDLFTRPPLRAGTNLILRSPGWDEREIALLFNMFALYFRY
ncbi:MAG: hypothetical protein LBT95_10635 [Treponema sp.]|jgi:hypothetical protein|nr:hypothetical protein [Treponema sp.]